MLGLLDVHQALLAQEVHHEIVHLSRSVSEADDIPAALGLESTRCGVVRVYASDDGPVAALLPAGRMAGRPQPRAGSAAGRPLRLRGSGRRPATRPRSLRTTKPAWSARSGCPVTSPSWPTPSWSPSPSYTSPPVTAGPPWVSAPKICSRLTGARVTWLTLPAERDRDTAEPVIVLPRTAATVRR